MDWETLLDGIDLENVKHPTDIAKHIKAKLKEGKNKLLVDSAEEPTLIPKARLDAEITKRKNAEQTVTDLKKDLEDNADAKDKIETFEKEKKALEDKIANIEKSNAIKAAVKGFKQEAHNLDDIVNTYLDLEAITVKDGKVTGLTEQLDALAKDKSYLFKPIEGGTGGPGQPGGKKDIDGKDDTLGDKLAKGAFEQHDAIVNAQNDFFK